MVTHGRGNNQNKQPKKKKKNKQTKQKKGLSSSTTLEQDQVNADVQITFWPFWLCSM